jgi:hypothetical protein
MKISVSCDSDGIFGANPPHGLGFSSARVNKFQSRAGAEKARAIMYADGRITDQKKLDDSTLLATRTINDASGTHGALKYVLRIAIHNHGLQLHARDYLRCWWIGMSLCTILQDYMRSADVK